MAAAAAAGADGGLPPPAIRGGGRAALSDKSFEMVADLLRGLRDPDDPLRPAIGGGASAGGRGARDDEEDAGDSHSSRRERRRFIKRMVERYERRELVKRVNGVAALRLASPGRPDGAGGGNRLGGASAESPAATGPGDASGRVRIVLTEAVFSAAGGSSSAANKSKGSGKEGGKEKKDRKKTPKREKVSNKKDGCKGGREWRDGSVRKTLVLARSTPLTDLLKTSKAKLNMKKKPVRSFYVDPRTSFEVDLATDLAGMEDDSVVYVTSHAVEAESFKGGSEGKDKDDASRELGNDLMDPLEPVKEAYAERKARRARKRRRPLSGGNVTEGVAEQAPATAVGSVPRGHPTFADHLDNLEPLPPARAALPAAAYRRELLTSLDSSRVVVICGATGCGKSTNIPQYILEGMVAAGREESTNIIVTQPRRVAATSLGERVAAERNSPSPGSPGSVVGYNVRLARRVSPEARIVYCTVGILLRMLVSPSDLDEHMDDVAAAVGCEANEGTTPRKNLPRPLSSISHVIIDEVHERDLNTDFALTLLRSVLAENPDIRIVLMSATSSPDLFVNYFRSAKLGITPIVLSIPGRTFPVSNNWLTDCEKFVGTRLNGWSHSEDIIPMRNQSSDDEMDIQISPQATARIDYEFVCKLIVAIVRKQRTEGHLDASARSRAPRKDGAVLVFCPGKGEISALSRVLLEHPVVGDRSVCNVLKLHSTVSSADQRLVFRQASAGIVKIVLATNVAETSITISDVSSVIDTGRVKESRFNASSRIRELVTVWTSKASATQRAGRSGRTGPGVCWRLYSKEFFNDKMPARTSPEIMRTPLDELVLQCCLLQEQRRSREDSMGTSPIQFLRQAPEPPPIKSLLHACNHLLEVGGLELLSIEPEYRFQLTPLGYHLAHLPMDAKVAKCLIVGCILECIEPALTIAASLSHTKSIWLPFVDGGQLDRNETRKRQEKLVEEGFGGRDWRGGVAKGDLIGVIAAYNSWMVQTKEKDRRKFASKNGLDHNILKEVHSLRCQFKDALNDAGFLDLESKNDSSRWSDDALFTSCCLVAGLYPNVATLVRPQKGRGNFRGGRFITKDGDLCKASSNSFQSKRLQNTRETGLDAYTVYHEKHRTVGTDTKAGQGVVFLNEVNFVSRYALLLFAGSVETRGTAIVLDGWLKFKVGEKSRTGAILIVELRKELDNVMTRHIASTDRTDVETYEDCKRVLQVVRKLLVDEAG